MLAGTLTYDTKMDTKGLQSGAKTIKSIVAGLGIDKILSKGFNLITSSLDGAIDRLDTLNNFPKVMSNLGVGVKDSEEAIQDLSQRLKGIPTTLDDAAMSVERFTSKNGDVKKSVDIFDAVNNAILAGGASADIQKSALEQLSQAYSKGKPDMMEWRTIQMAMPAQLNQVASAMGKTTDQLGEDLRKGNISMDDFIDTIIKLNKEGTAGFASFEQQAKNSTGGIKTSITTAKTAVTRGVANIVKSLNEGLANAGLGGIGQIFAKLGGMAENSLNFISGKVKEILPKILNFIKKIIEKIKTTIKNENFKKTFENLKKIAKITFESILKSAKKIYEFFKKNIIPILVQFYKAIKNKIDTTNFENLKDTIQELAPVINAVIMAFLAFKGVSIVITIITTLKKAFVGLFATLSANPIGVIIAGLTALIILAKQLSEAENESGKRIKEQQDAIQKQAQEVDQAVNSWNNLKEAQQKQYDAGMKELEHTQALYEELTQIVDENGKVKEGYEDRAKFITTELKDALGIEIEYNNGVIDGYKELRQNIDETIKMKKAKILLDKQEAKYKEAIENESKAINELAEADKNLNNAKKNREKTNEFLQETEKKLEEAIKNRHYHEATYYEATKIGLQQAMKEREKEVATAQESYDKLSNLVGEYGYNKQQWEQNMVLFSEKRYDEMTDIEYKYLKNHQDVRDGIKAQLEDEVSNQKRYVETLKGIRTEANKDMIDKEIEAGEKKLTELEKNLSEYNETTSARLKDVENTWDSSLGSQISKIYGSNVEFKDAGNGQIQAYVDGVEAGKPRTVDEMKELTEDAIEEIYKQKGNSESAGINLIDGLINGITNPNRRSTVFGAISSLGRSILGTLKNSLQEQSPSKASYQMALYLLEGFDNSIKDNQRDVFRTVDSFGDEVINRMSNAVNLETGKINAKASILSNINKTIQINNKFEGDIELDNRKVGKIIAPEVSKAIKAGGL